jgi:phosphohistidine phosphatase
MTELYGRLPKLRRESSVLLVGHERYLSRTVSESISGGKGSRILLKKAGMAKVAIDSLVAKPSGGLRRSLTPRQIKRTLLRA